MSSILEELRNDPIPGVNPNRAVRSPGAWSTVEDLYDLLFVEFDDQGRPFDPEAIRRVLDHLDRLSASCEVVVMLFVHGWKHSARESDDNVMSVRRLLHTAGHTEVLRPKSGAPRRVVGVYVGWRGLSLHWAGLLENLTFWGRKEAALRVAMGSVRELFARLRQFRLKAGAAHKDGTRLIIAGHSFGSLVVHAAVAEYLVESAVISDNMNAVLPFGDMTILVNPAFEASRYYPLHSLVAAKSFAPRQAPVFISVTAENDHATGLAFPAGRHLSLWKGASVDEREREANFNTMGHVSWMQTHELKKSAAAAKSDVKLTQSKKLGDEDREETIAREDAAFQAFLRDQTDGAGRLKPGWTRTYTAGAEVRSLSDAHRSDGSVPSPENPFWVVRASPEIVDGHNDIFGFVFLDFLRQFLDDAIRMTAAGAKR